MGFEYRIRLFVNYVLGGTPEPADAAAAAAAVAAAMCERRNTAALDALIEDLKRSIVQPEDISDSWEAFPHYVGDGTRDRLSNTAFLHLKRPEFSSHVGDLASMSNRLVLCGPNGSDLYQERLVR